MGNNKNNIWMRVVAFTAVFLLLCSMALVQDGRLFGRRPGVKASAGPQTVTAVAGGEIINTTVPGKDITGYGGPVPLEIYVSDGRIDSIRPLPNSETPGFFAEMVAGGLLRAWDGLTLEEAARLDVDAVSGATYSSRAVIGNVRAGVSAALDRKPAAQRSVATGAAGIAALVVLLVGAVLPLFVHSPRYRLVQQLANVGVLGFWAGTFVDYAMMLNFFANGVTMTLASLTALLLMVVALVYPLAGRGTHYCNWICPYGSLQELAGRLSRRKLKLSPTAVVWLDRTRQTLWVVLIALLFAGWGASWVDYELFTAFIVRSASWVMIGVGAAFIVLSVFISRPFCRFVCPTGSLLKEI